MCSYLSPQDLAGEVCFQPNFFQTRARINHLIDKYINRTNLYACLEDLPKQWQKPQPRQWQKINWKNINEKQIIDIKKSIFLAIISGSIDTEAPIRKYIQTSRQYLEPIHPVMAKFVGGLVGENSTLEEVGLWEKEERQHTPALIKIYRQLTDKKITPKLPEVKNYRASADPYTDLYHHGIHRIATEYAAVCLYLWLMARSTGELQQVFQEILQDEINHLSKFWGFGLWLYSHSTFTQNKPNTNPTITKNQFTSYHRHSFSRLKNTLFHMMNVLAWNDWTSIAKIELIYTFILIWQRMHDWSTNFSPTYLKEILNQSNLNSSQSLGNNTVNL